MGRKLDFHSKVKEIYTNPVGHDILHKLMLQLNIRETWLLNPLIGNLRLKTLRALTAKILGKGFFDTFLKLLNKEEDTLEASKGEITRAWWKQAVFYQIYPRSFQDSDGDGIGDIRGIISRLDYLKDLGIDAIWLSPIYDSPNDDNGYDIRDYYGIMKEFGTMEDFDLLLEEVHSREMRLIMDLVVNHTSDEHPWFKAAITDVNSKYHDYYFFKKSKNNNPPNNWSSFFSGSAWNYYEKNDEWGLHLFSKKQMDLNWENEQVREEIYQMIRWWLKKGIDGFRLDVINYISKEKDLPPGDEKIGQLMGYYGIEHYFYGPKLHQYLQEMRREAFEPFGAFTVGETPGVGLCMSRLLTAESRKELDMVFSFDHLETPGHVRFEEYLYDLRYLKQYMTEWMEQYGNDCWMSLFYENHDNPRMVSKVEPDPMYREAVAKLLAMLMFTLKGTPFVYQGQELGAVNCEFTSVGDLRDVESINLYEELLPELGEQEALRKVLSGSRDHARTPMQWNDSPNAGFTEGTPWIGVNKDYAKWNVAKQSKREDSVLNFYKRLIAIRKKNLALVYGSFQPVQRRDKNVFNYIRELEGNTFYVECNLSKKKLRRKHPVDGYQLLLSNYREPSGSLRAYEANLYVVRRNEK